MSIKYALHPGPIKSKNDRDWHYISARQLAFLYKLRPDQYIVIDEKNTKTYKGRDTTMLKHLYPDHQGKYDRTRNSR